MARCEGAGENRGERSFQDWNLKKNKKQKKPCFCFLFLLGFWFLFLLVHSADCSPDPPLLGEDSAPELQLNPLRITLKIRVHILPTSRFLSVHLAQSPRLSLPSSVSSTWTMQCLCVSWSLLPSVPWRVFPLTPEGAREHWRRLPSGSRPPQFLICLSYLRHTSTGPRGLTPTFQPAPVPKARSQGHCLLGLRPNLL